MPCSMPQSRNDKRLKSSNPQILNAGIWGFWGNGFELRVMSYELFSVSAVGNSLYYVVFLNSVQSFFRCFGGNVQRLCNLQILFTVEFLR